MRYIFLLSDVLYSTLDMGGFSSAQIRNSFTSAFGKGLYSKARMSVRFHTVLFLGGMKKFGGLVSREEVGEGCVGVVKIFKGEKGIKMGGGVLEFLIMKISVL